MPRYDRGDILIELIELCREIKSDIFQQLTYYRASVYKSETAQIIETKMLQMQTIAELCGSDLLSDAFHDYEEMKRHALLYATPGDCVLSLRLTRFFQSTDAIFIELQKSVHQPSFQDSASLAKNVRGHRRQLLSMCRQGSRHWAFFNGL